MVFCLGTEGSNCSLFRNGWFQCFLVWELKVPMFPYLEMGGSKWFSLEELKVPMVPCLEMVDSMLSCLGAEGSKGSLFRNGWFQCLSV